MLTSDTQGPDHSQGPTIRVGCTTPGRAPQTYFRRFSALEYASTFQQPPRQRVLDHLRRQAPEGFGFFLRAWRLITHDIQDPGRARLPGLTTILSQNCGFFQDTPEVHGAWRATLDAAQRLDAAGVIFSTPAGFAPSARNLEQMRRFFSAAAGGARQLIWEPAGLWSPREVEGICHELDLIPCLDPLTLPHVQVREAARAYFKVRGLGRHQPLSPYEIDLLADTLETCRAATCIMATPHMYADAARLLERLGKVPADQP